MKSPKLCHLIALVLCEAEAERECTETKRRGDSEKSKFRSRFRLSEADRKYIAVRYCAGAIASQHAGMREA